jgi:hypothetical protein
MAEELFEIGAPVSAETPPASLRAQALHEAIVAHPDFEFLEKRTLTVEGERADIFIVRCTHDEVPAQNPVGIHYQEPLALLVWENPTRLAEVRALRRDFPVTWHQNVVPDGEPSALCLYIDRPAEVLRTWTPQGFLRRIHWWLAQTAKGTLHGPEQAVEQLFFESPYELILPPGFDKLLSENSADPCARLALTAGIEREGRSMSFFTRFVEPHETIAAAPTVRFIAFTVDPIMHGPIERTPSTLGSLDATLRRRGAPLMEKLLESIGTYVGAGRAREPGVSSTMLLLRLPILRAAGGAVERIERRGFWITSDLLTIGEAAGLLFKPQGLPEKFYVDHLSTTTFETKSGWRELQLIPLNLLDTLTPALARDYSGVSEAGPTAVLAGAGALGGELFQLWRRAGWGQWTILDPDHLRPHNPSRHPTTDVGNYKADALAKADAELFPLQGQQTSFIAESAAALGNADVLAALKGASLIVDVTTTVEVPRKLARRSDVGRIVSCFVTPTGSDAVLLAEDRARLHRIDAIETQYYRRLLHEPWGEAHLSRCRRSHTSYTNRCSSIRPASPFSGMRGCAPNCVHAARPRCRRKPGVYCWAITTSTSSGSSSLMYCTRRPIASEPQRAFGAGSRASRMSWRKSGRGPRDKSRILASGTVIRTAQALPRAVMICSNCSTSAPS